MTQAFYTDSMAMPPRRCSTQGTAAGKPPLILHLIATNFYGGPERQIVKHLSVIDRNRYRGAIASFLEHGNANETLDRAREANVSSYSIPMMGPLDLRALVRLAQLVRREHVDLLCAHGYKSAIFGWFVQHRLRVPVLAFSRGYTGESIRVSLYEWLERRTLPKLSGIICVCEGQRELLKSMGIRARAVWVVHNAVSVEEYEGVRSPGDCSIWELRRSLGIAPEAHLLVAAGRLSPEKGHRYLVEAVAELGSDGPEAVFAFCGDGVCRRELESLADRLGVAGRCRFLGFRHDLKRIFHAMDLLVLPSLTEGLPNVVLEAFACAKPVVATAVGGVPEIVEDGVNGVLVPPRRPDLLARAIRSCLADPQRLRAMGARGREKVRSEFTFEKQAERLEAIYDEVLARHGRLRASESG